MFNLPNSLTLVRVGLGVLGSVLLGNGEIWAMWTAFVVMFLAAISDTLDGEFARKFKQVTDLGKLFDPMVDALYFAFIYLAFVHLQWIDAWMAGIFISRDLIVAYARAWAASEDIIVSARWSGKIKGVLHYSIQITITFLYASCLSFLDTIPPWSTSIVLVLISIDLIWTVYSLIDYLWGIIPAVLQKKSQKSD